MVINGWWSTLHKVNNPFIERTNSDDEMEESWWGSCFWGKMLAIGVVFDCLNAITEERRPKVTSTHDFLGSGHTGEVTTISAIVISI